MTVGRILLNRDGKMLDKGSGFLLATRLGEPSRVVLTANHVVRDQEAASLHFALEEGRTVSVQRVERDEDLDVAVLHLSEDVPEGLAVSRAVEGAFWQVEARPRGNDPKLTGTISAVRRPFKNAQGRETHVMQLLVDQAVGEYEGYSGSPVVLQSREGAVNTPVTPGASPVIAVLVEQLRWRLRDSSGQLRPASNVLYAIAIEDVLNQFGLTVAWAMPVSESRLPVLSEHLIAREKELDLVKEDLLRDVSQLVSGGRQIALVGMGGVGKTVMAAQLAHDQDIQRAFPHGVVWLELDATPLVQSQSRLAAAFGNTGQTFPDWVQGRDQLRRLLADRACLIVLDNVWKPDELNAFNILGPQGRLLFTTRDADLARSYRANVYNVGLLQEDPARELLADWAGLAPTALPSEAGGVLDQCAGLPLAIAMAGAMVRGRPQRWPSLLHKLKNADINKIAARLPGYPYPNLLTALDVGVEDLDAAGQERGLRNARDLYVDLAVFAGRGAVPASALAALWTSADVDEDEVEDYVELFVDRSLAGRDSDGYLALHDLQMDYVNSQAREQLPTLHGLLVDGYARRCQAGWAFGPNDGYYFQYLPHHLAQAGRSDELRALLADATWIRAKLAAVGVATLVADYALVPSDAGLQMIHQALLLSADVLAQDPNHLESQLIGRLGDQQDSTVQQLLETAAKSRTGAWLQPLTRSLVPPSSVLRRVLRVPSDDIAGGPDEVALSQDGHIAVCQALYTKTGGTKAEARLLVWNLQSLEEPRELLLPNAFGHLAVTGDGRLAALAAGPWDLEVVNLVSGAVVDQTRTKLNPKAVAIADAPPRVVVGHLDGWVSSWIPGGGSAQVVQVFRGEHVRAIAISADGGTAVVMSNYGSLVRLPLPDMQPVQPLGEDPGAFDLGLSPDGRYAVTGGHDRSLSLWDLDLAARFGHPARVLPPQEARINAISVVDGDRAVTALEDGVVQVWDLVTGQVLASADFGTIGRLAVSRDGRAAIARQGRERVSVLDLAALTAKATATQQGRPTAVAVTQDGRVAFAGSTDGVLTRFDIPPQPETAMISARHVAEYRFDRGGLSFSGEWSGTVPIFHARDNTPCEWIWSRYMDITRIGVSPNGRHVAWASSHRNITTWQGADHPPRTVTWQGGTWISSVFITSTGLVVAVHVDGTISYGKQDVWDQWKGPLPESDDRILCAAAPNERSRVLGTKNGCLILQNQRGDMLRIQVHDSCIKAVAITPDGAIIVSGADDGTVAVLQPHLSAVPRVVHRHSGPVRIVAISPDGKFAVSCSTADDIMLWALPNLTPVASFHCDGEINDVALAAGASLVVVADSAAGVHLLSPIGIITEHQPAGK